MDLLIVFLVSVIIFAVQLKLCRTGLDFLVKMIPVWIIVLAAAVVSAVYGVLYWGYGTEEYTAILFTLTIVLIYFGVADGMAWLLNHVINLAEERKYNS